MQVNARINQDQNISKDLTLWNQQGSQVLQGQTLVLPVGDTFLYVSPIYLQATQARMPQLKKVVLAVGNRLIYADTYEEALAQLSGGGGSAAGTQPSAQQNQPPAAGAAATPDECAEEPRPADRKHPPASAALSRSDEPGQMGGCGTRAGGDPERGSEVRIRPRRAGRFSLDSAFSSRSFKCSSAFAGSLHRQLSIPCPQTTCCSA